MAYSCGPKEEREAVLEEEEARMGMRKHTLRLTKQFTMKLSKSNEMLSL